jgi:hypothetical protein
VDRYFLFAVSADDQDSPVINRNTSMPNCVLDAGLKPDMLSWMSLNDGVISTFDVFNAEVWAVE